MKCFNHPQLDALGVCKNCQKGICSGCLTDTGSGLACNTGDCVQKTEGINRIINRQIKMYGSTQGAVQQRTLFYIAFALFFFIIGAQIHDALMQGVIIAMGVLFILMSVGSYRQQKKLG